MVRKVIYFSDSKFPLAGLAGAIHTGQLKAGGEPISSRLWSLPFMNLQKNREGKMISLGEDGQGNQIYALSVNGERGMVYRVVKSFLDIYKFPEQELRLVDSGLKDNFFLTTGALFYRFGFLVFIGRYLSSVGIKKNFGKLTKLVTEVKTGLTNLP